MNWIIKIETSHVTPALNPIAPTKVRTCECSNLPKKKIPSLINIMIIHVLNNFITYYP